VDGGEAGIDGLPDAIAEAVDAALSAGATLALGADPGRITAKSPNAVTTLMNVPPNPVDDVLSRCHAPSAKRAIVASATGGLDTRRTTLTPADSGAVRGLPASSVTVIR
jgi:hypothetical protein